MDNRREERKKAKHWLEDATDVEYTQFVAMAKLTPQQKEILDLVILQGMYQYEVSEELAMSKSKIKRICARIYDRVIKLKKF